MKKKFQFFGIYSMIILFSSLLISCSDSSDSSAFKDNVYQQGVQTLPGKIQSEYYNLGGEGFAYHDTDTSNNGSGNLNKGNDYLSTFRKDEAVDISYTKFHDSIDNSAYNLVQPEEGQLYVGWTEPGEWIKYSVDVKEAGTYRIGLMYTSNQNGQISISSDDGADSGLMDVSSTFDAGDSLDWRQWHHWNYDDNIGEIDLKEGEQVLTLHTVTTGQMNYDYLSFSLNDSK